MYHIKSVIFVKIGTHDELINNNNYYYEMYLKSVNENK